MRAMSIVKYLLPPIAYAGLIFFVSSLSQVPLPNLGFDLTDKVAHLLEYAFLSFLIVRAGNHYPQFNKKVVYTTAILFSILFAASDEYHQSFVIGRCADILDFVADTVGTFCGAYAYLFISNHRHRRRIDNL